MNATTRVYLGVPHSGILHPGVVCGVASACSNKIALYTDLSQCGCLPHNFNILWADALNRRAELGLTHFAMCHSDVHPEAHWIDKMIDEMDSVKADVLSAVIAIKDERGLSSTGLRKPESWKVDRLTMHQVHALPETFSAADTQHPNWWLAINTGLWICDFTRPWVEEFANGNGGFQVRTTIRRVEDGTYKPFFFPEDWDFGGWIAKKGLKSFATRKINARHAGHFDYPNDRPWGTWTHDRDHIADVVPEGEAHNEHPGVASPRHHNRHSRKRKQQQLLTH